MFHINRERKFCIFFPYCIILYLFSDKFEQFLSFFLHEGFVGAAFDIEAEHRFRVGTPHIEAPIVKFHGKTVYFVYCFCGIFIGVFNFFQGKGDIFNV